MNFNAIYQKLKGGLGLIVLIVVLGLVLGFGLRKCSSFPTPEVSVKDSVHYNIKTVDSTFIVWDTQRVVVENPVPASVRKADTKKTFVDHECSCIEDSIRTYVGRIKVGDFGFVTYNLKAIGTITDMTFSNQIGVQNRVRIVQSDQYRSTEKTIDNTPFMRVYAGVEFSPLNLKIPNPYVDINFKKWMVGYKYNIRGLNPHTIRIGYKIFDL